MPAIPPPASGADILRFLPTHGDGRYLGIEIGARHATDELGLSASCCPPDDPATIPGSSPQPWCRCPKAALPGGRPPRPVRGGRYKATAGYLTVWRQLMQGDRLLISMATTGA
jgi:hypothetical protein